MKRAKKIFKNSKGQAIFEMMMFLPFFGLILILFLRISSSINMSINQVKATRGYMHAFLQGNSYLPGAEDVRGYQGDAMSMAVVGWAEHQEGKTPVASCLKLPAFSRSQTVQDTCDTKPIAGKSDFVRIYTVYGICGTSYNKASGTPEIDYENANTCVMQ